MAEVAKSSIFDEDDGVKDIVVGITSDLNQCIGALNAKKAFITYTSEYMYIPEFTGDPVSVLDDIQSRFNDDRIDANTFRLRASGFEEIKDLISGEEPISFQGRPRSNWHQHDHSS
jgi:hypothetical protein